MRLLLLAALIAGLAWWLLRPRRRTAQPRSTSLEPTRKAVRPKLTVTGRVVRYGRASGDPIYGLWCQACGHIGEAVGQRAAEWASSEHLRLEHSGRRA